MRATHQCLASEGGEGGGNPGVMGAGEEGAGGGRRGEGGGISKGGREAAEMAKISRPWHNISQ